MKYTQSQWDKEIGWGKVPEKYKYKNKLEEYKDKMNYDIWEDVAHVQGITFNRQPYNIKEVKVTYNMKEDNDELQSHTSETTRTHNRNDKS